MKSHFIWMGFALTAALSFAADEKDFSVCIDLTHEEELPAAFFNRAKTYVALGRFNEAAADMNRFSEKAQDIASVREARRLVVEW